jgi:hypothetical protein
MGVTNEVILEEVHSKDDEALTVDLAAFRDAQRRSTSASGGRVGSNSTQNEVINVQLHGIDTE